MSAGHSMDDEEEGAWYQRRSSDYEKVPVSPHPYQPHPPSLLTTLIRNPEKDDESALSSAGSTSATTRKCALKFNCPLKPLTKFNSVVPVKRQVTTEPMRASLEKTHKICAGDLVKKDFELALESDSDDGFASDDEDGNFSDNSESSFTNSSNQFTAERDEERMLEADADLKEVEKETFALDEDESKLQDYCRRLENIHPMSPNEIDPSWPATPPSSHHHSPRHSDQASEGQTISRFKSLPHIKRSICPAIQIKVKKMLESSL